MISTIILIRQLHSSAISFIDTNFLMLSAELGYYDLGSYDSNDVDVDASAFTLAGVAYYPLGPYSKFMPRPVSRRGC